MTTSSYTSWELNRNDLIERAYAKLGIPGEGNTLSTQQYTDGNTALNSVIALAQTDGMSLWKRTTAQVTPSTTSQVYTIANAVKIAGLFLRDTGGTQYELQNKSLYDFMRLPRNAIGIPTHWTWQPSIEGGTVSIWPLTSDSSTVSTKTIQIIYQKEFDGFDSTTIDTLDFPAYWTLAIVYKTAVILAPESGIPLEDRKQLQQEANEYWKRASDYGDEDGSFYIQPDRKS
jgi:hypothetical protein